MSKIQNLQSLISLLNAEKPTATGLRLREINKRISTLQILLTNQNAPLAFSATNLVPSIEARLSAIERCFETPQ